MTPINNPPIEGKKEEACVRRVPPFRIYRRLYAENLISKKTISRCKTEEARGRVVEYG